MNWRSLWTMIVFSVFLVGNDGCKTTEDYRGRDQGIFFPYFRASADLSPALKAELDFVYGSGKSSQGLGASDFLSFKGQTFNGPVKIKSDYDLHAFTAVLRFQYQNDPTARFKTRWGSFWGIGAQHFRLKLSAQGINVEERNRTYGPLGGGISWCLSRLHGWIYSAGTASGSVSENTFRAWRRSRPLLPSLHIKIFPWWRDGTGCLTGSLARARHRSMPGYRDRWPAFTWIFSRGK